MFNHQVEHLDENMMMIQCNLDDMNPEYTPYVTELLFEAGANDVYWTPIIMKKGRPGMMLNVLVDEKLRGKMEEIIFKETTTLGLRFWPVTCHRLARKSVQVQTRWGNVEVKTGEYQGQFVQFAPEYEQCKAIAVKHGIPLKAVYQEVRRSYEQVSHHHEDDA